MIEAAKTLSCTFSTLQSGGTVWALPNQDDATRCYANSGFHNWKKRDARNKLNTDPVPLDVKGTH
ncbi:hypothetical protein PAXRUDRAFT_826380 [Paxillus rubicundulus Ve08.2h10]|uniref:Uncharacterized protein n=1 Tax=Paxillus rubicundulus Ve08.2h10 TaxID=930991 RepID=A0A0D0E4G5_9AGAM|nr:hypothetical protein PAXRUDRAFT_826380 [Paxillus rubicundulus Ve08.2h10]